MVCDIIVAVYLLLWTVACVSAFVCFYCSSKSRNPDYNGQLYSPSGLVKCNPMFFGFFMCGYSGAALLAVGVKLYTLNDIGGLVCFLFVFMSWMLIVHVEIRDYKTAHIFSLCMFMITNSVFFVIVDFKPAFMMSINYITLALFIFVLMLNVCCTRWKSPYMTLQVITEIIWLITIVTMNAMYAIQEAPGFDDLPKKENSMNTSNL